MQPQRFAWEGGRRGVAQYVGTFCVLLPLVTGCATVDQQAGFAEVHAAITARSGKRVVWNRDTALDAQVAEDIQTLLHGTLTADAAIQVALLNNRDLQAMYADLGVAQADLVQAGLLRNPVFDGIIRFPVSGGPAELELSAALGFLDLFYLPLRQRVAAAQFEEVKLQVTAAVLDFAGYCPGRVLSSPGQHAAPRIATDDCTRARHLLGGGPAPPGSGEYHGTRPRAGTRRSRGCKSASAHC